MQKNEENVIKYKTYYNAFYLKEFFFIKLGGDK